MVADLLVMWRLNREKKLEARIRIAKAGVQRAKEKARVAWLRVRDLRAERDALRATMAGGPVESTSVEGTEDLSVVTMRVGHKRHYNNGEAEFILDPLSDCVVMVTHRDQVGYFGFSQEWDPAKPYAWADSELFVQDDGIEDVGARSYSTPVGALQYLCDVLFTEQVRQDARSINPEERQRAARQVLAEFMAELPD